MYPYQLPSAAASVVSVTGTATGLQALLNTANGSTITFPDGLNAVDLTIENGDVRVLYDGNTPTASAGLLLKQGSIHRFRGIPFSAFKFIAVSGTVNVDVVIGMNDGRDVVHSSSLGGSSSGSGSTADQVQGNSASGVADTGNPIKVAGKYNASIPTFTDGQRADLQMDSRGAMKVTLTSSGTTAGVLIAGLDDNSDNVATVGTANRLSVQSRGTLFNGTSWDRKRGNLDVVLLSSAARTTTQTSADQLNYNARGIDIVVDVTSVGTGSITMTLNYKDPASGKYITLLSGAAITTNSTNVYRLYPGLTASANATANDILPRTFQIVITANNANPVTYSVGCSLTV